MVSYHFSRVGLQVRPQIGQYMQEIAHVPYASSFGNIAAMMQIKTRDFGGPSRRAIILYNVSFVSTLLIAFGLGLVSTSIGERHNHHRAC